MATRDYPVRRISRTRSNLESFKTTSYQPDQKLLSAVAVQLADTVQEARHLTSQRNGINHPYPNLIEAHPPSTICKIPCLLQWHKVSQFLSFQHCPGRSLPLTSVPTHSSTDTSIKSNFSAQPTLPIARSERNHPRTYSRQTGLQILSPQPIDANLDPLHGHPSPSSFHCQFFNEDSSFSVPFTTSTSTFTTLCAAAGVFPSPGECKREREKKVLRKYVYIYLHT